jgi:2-polyprenyl-6-methoxyphenol hydroxylase-like FAD-dependent oxidoreductase
MAQEQHVPVLIVGAGGAGLSLSLLLQQQGIASLLVERRPDVSWFPRARNLNFRTLEVFRGLGLEAQVLAAGTHVSRMFRTPMLASPQREELQSVDEAFHIADHPELLTPEPPFWYCPQSRLEPLLLAAAKQRGCDVRHNHELVSFTQDAEGVSATISDRATGTAAVVRADYLAACDGAHSQIREALGVKAEGLGVLDEHYIFIYFRADWSALIRGDEADAILIQQPGFQGIFLITDADRGMLLIQEAAAQDYTAERCKELVLDGIGQPDLAVEIVDIAHWQPAQLVAEHFGQGRVFLVGDAAHTMPPKLGLGVNTAIQSAQNLAWKLAAVIRGQASPELLATYEPERHPVGQLASQQSLVGPAASVLTQGSDDKLLPAEKRVPLFSLIVGYRYRSRAILSEDAVAPDQAAIELLEKPEELGGQPGTRVPHMWFERRGGPRGQRISTLDLLDGRFVLLTGTGGAAWGEAAAAVAETLGIALPAYRIGADADAGADLLDLVNGWPARLGVSAVGAVLVRPDGFVAWRASTVPINPESELLQALSTILCRATHVTWAPSRTSSAKKPG